MRIWQRLCQPLYRTVSIAINWLQNKCLPPGFKKINAGTVRAQFLKAHPCFYSYRSESLKKKKEIKHDSSPNRAKRNQYEI